MKSALEISGFDFAAGQRHGLENPLMPEGRVLIGFLGEAAVLDWALIVDFVVSLCHEKGRVATNLLLLPALIRKTTPGCHTTTTRRKNRLTLLAPLASTAQPMRNQHRRPA